jgi:hypothetical protein
VPDERVPETSNQDDSWMLTFAGDLDTSRSRFREMADVTLKHAEACLLNHVSRLMAVSLFSECGIDLIDRIDRELEEERSRIARRGLLAIVACKKNTHAS